MSRKIEWKEDHLAIKFTGMTSVAALKRHVEIPYTAIKKVSIENKHIPLLQFKVGTSVGDIREGRFLLDGKWCFVSYENHEHVLILELVGHEYDMVIIQLENPEEAKHQIMEKVQT
jgi:hypothetical protein